MAEFKGYMVRRKVVHFLLGIAFVIFINSGIINYKQDLILILLCGLILAFIASWYIKVRRPKHLINLLALFDKPEDLASFPAKGAVFYILGVLMSGSLFDKDIASASIMILTIGDPAAHVIGNYYGKTKTVINEKKLLEGTLAGTLAGAVAAMFFVPLPIAFFGSAFGMMAEAVEVEVFNLDDNFFIPFVSGLVMSLISLLI